MNAPAGWADILDEGEAILWQGRPDGAVKFRFSHILSGLFGLAFAGFALFWMVMASQAGGLFWMFGLIHFFVGLSIGIGPPFWSAWRRRHTWYTLSDQRAFIATDIPLRGRKLASYPLGVDTVLNFQAGDLDTIQFAHEMRRTKNGSRRHDIGFERIEGGQEVYRLMRKVQKSDD